MTMKGGLARKDPPPNTAHQDRNHLAHPGRRKCEARKIIARQTKQETNALKRLAHRVPRPARGGVGPFSLSFKLSVTLIRK